MKQFKLSGIVVPIITPIDKDENVTRPSCAPKWTMSSTAA